MQALRKRVADPKISHLKTMLMLTIILKLRKHCLKMVQSAAFSILTLILNNSSNEEIVDVPEKSPAFEKNAILFYENFLGKKETLTTTLR